MYFEKLVFESDEQEFSLRGVKRKKISSYPERDVLKSVFIIIIIITKSIFMVLSSWQAIARVHPVHLMNADSAPRWPPTPRPSQLTWTVSPSKERQLPSTSTNAILLLLSPRADTHFTIPRRVEG